MFSFDKILYFYVIQTLSGHFSEMITRIKPDMPEDDVIIYSSALAEETTAKGLEPETVVAVMWHESDLCNLPRNRTNDFGVLQVHWSRKHDEYWLNGLSKEDLMDPEVNIKAGVNELAFWKQWHQLNSRQYHHYWWGHYKYGFRIKSKRYERDILRKRAFLLNLTYDNYYIKPQ